MSKVGFACKWIDRPDQADGISAKDDCKKYNTRTTTIKWLSQQAKSVAIERLWDIAKHNIESIYLLVERVSKLPQALRMVRLSSDILPAYTHIDWKWFYQDHEFVKYAEKQFAKVGELARTKDVRLSFHPGQFTVLASENENIVNNSIEEFEYHVDMARWMGYGKQFQDFKINVHISGKRGPQGIRDVWSRLTPEARNTLTIENDENTWGIDSSLELADICALVLDIHHHWVNSGEYIENTDSRIAKIIDSWRGVRPVIHYSVTNESYLTSHSTVERPNLQTLVESGVNKQKLRTHSVFYHNDAVNQWATSHKGWADIMCESTGKNLASMELYKKYWKTHDQTTA